MDPFNEEIDSAQEKMSAQGPEKAAYASVPSAGQADKPPRETINGAMKRRITMPLGAIIACVIAVSLAVMGVMGGISLIKDAKEKRVQVITTSAPFVLVTDEPEATAAVPERTGGDHPSDAIWHTHATDEPSRAYSAIEDAMSAVVSIDVMVSYGYASVAKSSGSGVIVSEDGYIATCCHVIDGASRIYVYLDDGSSSEAKLIGRDSISDLAVIKIEGSGYPHAVFGDSETLHVGEAVFAVGNALGQLSNSYTRGVISGLDRSIKIDGKEMTLLQTDAAINRGNSGGGLFRSTDGALMGIVNAKSAGESIEGLGFAIPSDLVLKVIGDLMDYGFVTGVAYLGVEAETVALPGYGFFTDYHTSPKVIAVEENSPAEKAGIEVGDVILSVNGVSVSDSEMLDAAISACKIGDSISLAVMRNNEDIELEATLEGRGAPEE